MAAAKAPPVSSRRGVSDWYAFTLSFKGVLLEGCGQFVGQVTAAAWDAVFGDPDHALLGDHVDIAWPQEDCLGDEGAVLVRPLTCAGLLRGGNARLRRRYRR